eukprot:CAMPEP_0194330942 /NCGR_PEP_ID=MMETSP0171-20130528/53844_1 /TAXON_ID=218684 /ORGANISM="Corethron pennatum, Strain L29A3" /LENGTH=339 /DNA_ID=CAMNT_0039092205 /DNA_START=222 /DNA_END=1237 /DNA_ORIENTATION=-
MSIPNRFLVRLIRASLAYGAFALISAEKSGHGRGRGRGRGKGRRRNNGNPVIRQPSNASGSPIILPPSNASSLPEIEDILEPSNAPSLPEVEVFGREQHDASLFVAAVDMGRSGADAAFALVSSDSCAFFGYLPISTAAECTLAAAALVPASAANYHDHKFADVTDGCTTFGGAATGSPVALLFQTDTCDVTAYGQYCGSCDSFFPCLCAVPPLPEFATATKGTCAGDGDARGGNGYRPVATLDECRRAARALYPDALDALGGAANVVGDDYADVIDGCIHNRGDRQIFLNPPGRCDHDSYPAYCANCDEAFVCLCVRETTEPAAEAPVAEGRYVRRTA